MSRGMLDMFQNMRVFGGDFYYSKVDQWIVVQFFSNPKLKLKYI
jgi:hypothetical protein